MALEGVKSRSQLASHGKIPIYSALIRSINHVPEEQDRVHNRREMELAHQALLT